MMQAQTPMPRISNSGTSVAEPAGMAMRFESGVLEMRCAYRHGAMGMHRDSDIRQLLEQGL